MSVIYKVKTTEALYNAAKQHLIGKSSTLTNFNVGGRTRTILEAIASINHRTQYDFSQAIKLAIPLAVYNGFEFEREPGVQANGELTFTRSTNAPETYTIPIGTAITLDGYSYETIVTGSIPIGTQTSGAIDAQASVEGEAANIAINAINTSAGQGGFVNQPAGIEAATNPTAFTNGADEESDEDRLKRFREFINSLARATVTGQESGAKTVDTVIAAALVENDPTPGFNKLYVDDGSGVLSSPLQAAVEKVINGDPSDKINFPGYRAAGTQTEILAPTLIDIPITADLKVLESSIADDTQLITLASNVIQAYINSLTLGFDVIRSEIIKVIKNASVDIYDVDLVIPSTNITIASTEKARIDSGNFNVTTTRIENP